MDGAENWSVHSWNGHTHAFTYDRDIQKTLAPRDPSEGSYNCEGKLWLDLQAEALEQAATILLRIANNGPKVNFADSEIKDCIDQLRDLIRDRESFIIGDQEHDEIFNEDIHYLKMAVQILEAIK